MEEEGGGGGEGKEIQGKGARQGRRKKVLCRTCLSHLVFVLFLMATGCSQRVDIGL